MLEAIAGHIFVTPFLASCEQPEKRLYKRSRTIKFSVIEIDPLKDFPIGVVAPVVFLLYLSEFIYKPMACEKAY
ncbi:MAG: hypothetical protein C4323_18095 [Mastigocladus sp. ERB_26_2]